MPLASLTIDGTRIVSSELGLLELALSLRRVGTCTSQCCTNAGDASLGRANAGNNKTKRRDQTSESQGDSEVGDHGQGKAGNQDVGSRTRVILRTLLIIPNPASAVIQQHNREGGTKKPKIEPNPPE